MAVRHKLNVDQISAAILWLGQDEKKQLERRLPGLLGMDRVELEDLGWLRLAEPALELWNDPAEDIYNDLMPANTCAAEPSMVRSWSGDIRC